MAALIRRSLIALGAALALLALGVVTRAAEGDKGVLADLISRVLSSATTTVSIGAVDGALSSDATIRDVVLSDRDGPWLKVDKVRLVWNRLALFSRRVEVNTLTIGTVEFLRKPNSEPGTAKAGDQPLLPDLPVKIIVKTFAIDDLSLGAPVAGVAAKLAMSGAATLGPPTEGLDLRLDAHRLDAGGTFTARLAYVPQTSALDVALKFNEPAGGLLAHLANIPGQPATTFDLDGAGQLDKFAAHLTFDGGPALGAKGEIDLNRNGAGRKLILDLQSRLEGALPAVASAIFAGNTALEGDVFLADSGAIDISGVHLTTATSRLDIEGGLDAARVADIRIHAGAIPVTGAPTKAGDAEIGRLEFNASVKGPLGGPAVEAKIDAGNITVPQGALGSLKGSFSAVPSGLFSDPATRVALAGDAQAAGLVLEDEALGAALGENLALTFRASADIDGAAQVDDFHLTLASLEAAYRGLIGPAQVKGKLTLNAPDLARFQGLAGIDVKGAATLNVDLTGVPREGSLAATLDGHATHFATGISPADGLLGGDVTLKGAASRLNDGAIGFQHLALTGLHGALHLDGAASAEHADLKATVDAPEARFIDPRMSGVARIEAALTGAGGKLDASVDASLRNGALMGRPVSGITLQGNARDVLGVVDSKATLSGAIDKRPLDGAFHVARQAEGGWRADPIALTLGSVRLAGDLSVDKDSFAAGSLSLKAANLDDLSPLALTPLSGDLDSAITLSAADGRQNVQVVMRSKRLVIGANSAAGLNADLTLSDARGAARIDGKAALASAQVGGQTIADVTLVAKGAGDASDLDLAAHVFGFGVQTRARLIDAGRLTLSSLVVQGGAQKLTLAHPTKLSYGASGLTVDSLDLATNGGGRLMLSGRAGDTFDLKLAAHAFPLAFAGVAAPTLGLSGTADANAAITGAPRALSGDWKVSIANLSTQAISGSGLPAIDLTGSGRLAGTSTSIDARVKAGAIADLRVSGRAPLAKDGALDLAVQGKVDAAAANTVLAASGRRVTGQVVIDAHVRGSIAKPDAQGSVSLSGGSFFDPDIGFKLENVAGRITAHGDQIAIERLGGSTPNGGTLNVAGQIRLDPAAGFPGTIHVSGQKAQLVATAVVTASADLALDVTGALAQDPAVRGRIRVIAMDISIPERLSADIRPLDDVRHLHPVATTRARLALAAAAKKSAGRAPPFNATLALDVVAPGRIFVRGRGLNAELGGDLAISGAIAAPQIRGSFTLQHGTLALLGQQLDFTRGAVVFHGGVTPDLDFLAEASASDITARIAITGPASAPAFTLSSQPSLPQDEILSRILFQKSVGSLTGFQALQLANAVSTLSGGADPFEKLRRSLGVDSLDLQTGASGGPAVGISRAINDRLSVGVVGGSRAEDNGVTVNYSVTKHIRAQAGVNADGSSSVGVGAEWEYK